MKLEQLFSNFSRARPFETMKWELFSKCAIKEILKTHAPHLNTRAYMAAAEIFPFRVNPYVVEKLIDWSNTPNDPMFKLTFPQPEMVTPGQLSSVLEAMDRKERKEALQKAAAEHSNRGPRNALVAAAEKVRGNFNPHPAGQKTQNVPKVDGHPLEGIQHKYRETMLFFPAEGQFCHTWCTYCFRWPQFTSVGSAQQFKSKNPERLRDYIAAHPNLQDVLFTGGDPMVMTTEQIRRYIDPILHNAGTDHLNTIRFGTKSLAYWPYRFLDDKDAKPTLKYFEDIIKSGKHVSIQAHFTHPRELETAEVQEAMRLIHMTGANIRTQSPVIRGINDSADVWAKMWKMQVNLGATPYYMFIERDTGAKDYFSLPLARAHEIYTTAKSRLAGTARHARGPSMSAEPGKIAINGVIDIPDKGKYFILEFLQARNPAWIGKPFLAEFSPTATWINELTPAFGAERFFYEDEFDTIKANDAQSSGQMNWDGPPCGSK
ncbi:putative L-lysine 2,3-aminomutase [Lachnellula suecica]|uniref:Putative L-lysine 2,3-aminomutase n=1 Tax=Lachnellula suecica TaxID=602035 RepID=A0A8T9CEM1_9HELO|nr:putative L-lysine 2,3-aminomutase [Lachnellula suecica]